MRKAVFLDRDGVINKSEVINGKPYAPTKIEDFEILPGVKKACKALKEKGYLVIVATNQPDISTGKTKKEDLEAMHNFMMHELPIDLIKICYSLDKDNDPMRKPSPGMILEAAKELMIDLNASFMVGDRWKDIDAGATAGCKTIFIDYKYNEKLNIKPNYCVKSLIEAAQLILQKEK
jgi:D-glycero-D-manno-heptose 1,7-bisphosphate phosphatase